MKFDEILTIENQKPDWTKFWSKDSERKNQKYKKKKKKVRKRKKKLKHSQDYSLGVMLDSSMGLAIAVTF